MYAIVEITAKVLALVNEVLEAWVTITENPATGYGAGCNVVSYSYTITDCGGAIIDSLQNLIFFTLQLGGTLLPALGVSPA